MSKATWAMVGLAAAIGCGTATAADDGHQAECGKCEEAHREPPSVVGQRVGHETLSDRWLAGEAAGDEAVTLVVFWEVWCPHCVRELPRLRDLDELDGIEVVGLTRLTRDATEGQVAKFVAEHDIGYAIGRDTHGLFERFGFRGVPAAVAVRDGAVVWQGHPATLTDADLARWR